MKEIQTKFLGLKLELRYIKGSSDIVSGVKKNNASKIEAKGGIGGNGTYRVNTGSTLEIVALIDKETHFINIKNIIKDELSFKSFSQKRIIIIEKSLPASLDFKLSDNQNQYFELDTESESVKKWISYLKKTFS